MEPLILKLLEEVDDDIKEIMLEETDDKLQWKKEDIGEMRFSKRWELLSSPLMEILAWQAMRDRNEELMKQAECHANLLQNNKAS